MTAPESTNAHGDAHGAALLRSRKRMALAAWDKAVAEWRKAGEPRGDHERDAYEYWPWRLASYQLYGASLSFDIAPPAFVAEGK